MLHGPNEAHLIHAQRIVLHSNLDGDLFNSASNNDQLILYCHHVKCGVIISKLLQTWSTVFRSQKDKREATSGWVVDSTASRQHTRSPLRYKEAILSITPRFKLLQ